MARCPVYLVQTQEKSGFAALRAACHFPKSGTLPLNLNRTGQARMAARTLARRHRVLQAILVLTAHRLMRYRTMHYELIAR